MADTRDRGLTVVSEWTTVDWEGDCVVRRWRRKLPVIGGELMEILVVLAILAVWLALQLWVLPKLGVST